MVDDRGDVRAPEVVSEAKRSSAIAKREWPDVVDRNLNEAIQAFRETQDRSYKIEQSYSSIDKGILLVLAISLLASLFYMFYLIGVDKLTPVTNYIYPTIALILGFMSGYFAGSGRSRGRRN